MKKFTTLLAALALVLITSSINAQPAQGKTEFTLSGSGASSHNLSENALGISTSFGYYLTDNIDASVRQTVLFNDASESDFLGSTGIGVDYNLKLGSLVPFFGIQAGVSYGDGQPNWVAGPEAGLKLYLKSDAFVFGRAAYNFDLNNRQGSEGDGFAYAIGIGLNF